jgi:hypothetical protein
MLNLAIKIIPPAITTSVGISGTENTRNPLSENSFLIFYKEELFPAQGPPVMAIL